MVVVVVEMLDWLPRVAGGPELGARRADLAVPLILYKI